MIQFFSQVLRLGARFDEESETIKFSNGLSLSEKQLDVGGFGTLTKTIFKFAKSLAQMSVDETEFALLAAISLMSGGESTQVLKRTSLWHCSIRIQAFLCYI